MIVGYRKQFSFPLHDPSFPVYCLAFGAVPVPAAVIEVPFMPAALAPALMPAQCSCPALGYGIKGLDCLSCLGVLLKEIAAVKMNYL